MLISGAPCYFCFIKFLPKHMAVAPETPHTPFMHSILRGVGVLGWKNPKNLPALEDHLCAKFHQDPSSGLDCYWEHTHTLPPCPPPGRLKLKNQKTHLLKFNFREILFYKYCTIFKNNLPPPGPPMDTLNSWSRP